MVPPQWATQDIIPHELTHRVTHSTCKLVYQNASGAISESLSEIFGEFVDFGDDRASVRRLFAEDSLHGSAFWSQKIPHAFPSAWLTPGGNRFDADRVGSPDYYPTAAMPGNANDNSGVSNKLAYLIADGDTFNGITTFAQPFTQTFRFF